MIISEKINERIENHKASIRLLKGVITSCDKTEAMIQFNDSQIFFLQDLLKDVEEMEFELGDLRSIENWQRKTMQEINKI